MHAVLAGPGDVQRAAALAADDPKGVTALAFSPDGAVLIAGDADGVLRLWDVTAP